MAQYVNSSLGLHCLLYLSADRVCAPQTSPPAGRVTESLSMSEHRLARVSGRAIEACVRMLWWMDDRKTRVSVPCLPEVKVGEWDLGSRLLMAALLECRDMGRIKLRLVEPRGSESILGRTEGFVQVRLLAGPPLDGLCGLILERLEHKGNQDAGRLLRGVTGQDRMIMGPPSGQRWVIGKVSYELVARGYTRRTSEGTVVFDCGRVQMLADECALAVDRWNRAWAADPRLCDALLAACTESIKPVSGGA